MLRVAHAHAGAEERGDLDATMATLDDDPTYELQPLGLVLRGRETVRAYYERFFDLCTPRIAGFDLRSEWVTDEGVGQEYSLLIKTPQGSVRREAVIGILTFAGGDRLSGERIYASDELLHFFFGPILDRATAI